LFFKIFYFERANIGNIPEISKLFFNSEPINIKQYSFNQRHLLIDSHYNTGAK